MLKAELAKLEFLRAHGADRLDLSALPAGRRRMLAETGRRSTNQALQRADVDRRYPILLATLAETHVEVLDESDFGFSLSLLLGAVDFVVDGADGEDGAAYFFGGAASANDLAGGCDEPPNQDFGVSEYGYGG